MLQFKKKDHIQVFEHQNIRLGETIDDVTITRNHLETLQLFNPNGTLPYYSLIHNGIKFCEYVGVISTSNLTIEILPKVDRVTEDKTKWQGILIDML